MLPDDWTLDAPRPDDAAVVASWSTSAAEADVWVSRAEHPFPPAVVASWWTDQDVTAYVLRDGDGVPAAYGELWDDEEEDEVEIARLIVDQTRRGQGVGRRLVRGLVEKAHDLGRGDVVLRVRPDNTAARGLYRATGFLEVDESEATSWNAGQPVAYTWMRLPAT